MLTLGIETSCDETSCSVLEGRDRILSNVISSSLFRHRPFGGVVPEIASRHCLEQIDVVFEEALREAGVRAGDLDLIAVTQGPGLIGSLFVGVSFAKSLSYALGIPLVAVNHLEAHLTANFIGREEPGTFVGLLVSGGHTILSHHEKGRVKILGATVDDAVGEAFDKVAKILGLGYPGGPVIEKLAAEGNPRAVAFTRPKQKNPLDFSFSGIKTAVLYHVASCGWKQPDRKRPGRRTDRISKKGLKMRPAGALPRGFVCDVAASFQSAVVGWLVEKTMAAARETGVRHIVVGGGVSANRFLRERLTEAGRERGLEVAFPERTLALDNAAMIARRGIEIFEKGKHESLTLTGVPNLKIGVLV